MRILNLRSDGCSRKMLRRRDSVWARATASVLVLWVASSMQATENPLERKVMLGLDGLEMSWFGEGPIIYDVECSGGFVI